MAKARGEEAVACNALSSERWQHLIRNSRGSQGSALLEGTTVVASAQERWGVGDEELKIKN